MSGRYMIRQAPGSGACAIERACAELGWTGGVMVARSFAERLLGMTVRPAFCASGRPFIMVFPRCRSVHTWFMRYPLDIAFADAAGSVLMRCEGISPWHAVSHPRASFVLERAALCRGDAALVGDGCADGYTDSQKVAFSD